MSRLLMDETLPLLAPAGFLANVVDVNDPDHRNRIQVRLSNVDGATNQNGAVWARVAVPFAGARKGAFFFPDVGDEVLVVHLSGDPRYPVVIGGLWNGRDVAPDSFGGSGDSVDRWTITGKAGTKIAIVEDSTGPTVQFTTPGQLSGTFTDSGGGSIEFTNGEQTSVKIDASGVTVNAPTAQVQITAAASATLTAPTLTVNAASSTFNGDVTCFTLNATTVKSAVYTPGAGNLL